MGNTQMGNGNRLMYERNDQADTVLRVQPKPQVTSAFHGVHVRLWTDYGQYYDYFLEHQLMIGRAEAGSIAEIQLPDAMVSQRHCRIYRQGEQILIQDLGSTNHTYLNGCRIEGTMPLTSGDTIKLGQTVFQFQYFV